MAKIVNLKCSNCGKLSTVKLKTQTKGSIFIEVLLYGYVSLFQDLSILFGDFRVNIKQQFVLIVVKSQNGTIKRRDKMKAILAIIGLVIVAVCCGNNLTTEWYPMVEKSQEIEDPTRHNMPTGACCYEGILTLECADVTRPECDALGGDWSVNLQGTGRKTCLEIVCE